MCRLKSSSSRIWLFLGLLVFLFFLQWRSTLPARAQSGDEELRVVTFIEEPWVMQEGDNLKGFHAELWDAIAKEAGLKYKFIVVKDFGEMLTMIEKGEADVAVEHIGVNEKREPNMNFTHEIFDDGIQIVVSRDRFPLVSALKAFLDPQTLQVLGAAVVVLLLFAHLVWLTEVFQPDSEFPKNYFSGIAYSLSWAMLTVISQEGIIAKNKFGRLISALWFFFLLFALSAFTAQLATAFTVGRLNGSIKDINDLRGKKVATWKTGKQQKYLVDNGMTPIFSKDDQTNELITMLQTGQVDALLLDIGSAYYFVNKFPDLALAGNPVLPGSAGSVAYPIVNGRLDLVEKINQAFLNVKANGIYENLYRKYFGVAPGQIH